MKIKSKIINKFRRLVRPHDKFSFVSKLSPRSYIFDIGCGNDSPFHIKSILPLSNYTGLDIGNYNQKSESFADTYILTTPEYFSKEIQNFHCRFDAVISTHNLEHCNNRNATLLAMLDAVKTGGQIYISFPCDKSINFPHRIETLNYYDDISHIGLPPDYNQILEILLSKRFEIIYTVKYNKPFFDYIRAALNENFSKIFRFNPKANWAYYGFESIIWARKLQN